MSKVSAALNIYVVRTDLDFVEVFLRPPRWDEKRKEWMKFARVYVFGSLYWRTNALKLMNILIPNVPRMLTLVTAGRKPLWTFKRTAQGTLDFFVGTELVETYCGKTMRAFRMHHVPIGLPIEIALDPAPVEAAAA